MNGLTLLGLLGMAWVALSVIFGVGIGRCCYDTSDVDDLGEWEAELSESAREAAKRWHPAGGRR